MAKVQTKAASKQRHPTTPPRRHRNKATAYIAAVGIVLSTLAFSPSLPDISNLPRMVCQTVTIALLTIALRKTLVIPRGIGMAAFTLFVLWQACTLLWAPNKAEALYEVARWLAALLSAVVGFTLFRRHPVRSVCLLSRVSATVFLLSAAVAVGQMIAVGDLQWSNRYSFVSLYTHKGTFSIMLLLLMAFPMMRLALGIRRARWFYIVLIVAEVALTLFLQARAALMGLAAILIAATLLLLLRPTRLRCMWHMGLTVVTAVAASLLIVGVCSWFANRSLPGPDNSGGIRSNASIYERQSLWSMTLRMSHLRPVTGCGAGNWKVCHPEVSVGDVFSIDVLDHSFTRPHNDYLRLLSEGGWPALVLMLIAIASLLLRAAEARGCHRRSGRIAALGAAFLVGVLTFALSDFPIDRTETLLWTTLIAACTAAATSTDTLRLPSRSWIVIMVVLAGVATVCISRWHSENRFSAINQSLHQRSWARMQRLSARAQTPLSNLAPNGTPWAYYEAMALEYQQLDAHDAFCRALRAAPFSKQLLSDMGRIEYVSHHATDTAIALLEEAIRISPSYSRAYFNLAQVYIQEHRYDKARAVLLHLDLDRKQQQMNDLVYHYHSGETAEYYKHDVLRAERDMRDRMLQQIEHQRTTDSAQTSLQ